MSFTVERKLPLDGQFHAYTLRRDYNDGQWYIRHRGAVNSPHQMARDDAPVETRVKIAHISVIELEGTLGQGAGNATELAMCPIEGSLRIGASSPPNETCRRTIPSNIDGEFVETICVIPRERRDALGSIVDDDLGFYAIAITNGMRMFVGSIGTVLRPMAIDESQRAALANMIKAMSIDPRQCDSNVDTTMHYATFGPDECYVMRSQAGVLWVARRQPTGENAVVPVEETDNDLFYDLEYQPSNVAVISANLPCDLVVLSLLA